ncbi:hypothetical protein [Salininema proteolyticum]|uniref:Uncharacterized protein n=1 Tax=Salininema proteolyticum TaxID=1607685 RepID=A0ABV8TT99_9ACTN
MANQVHQRPGVQLAPVFVGILALTVTVTLAMLTPAHSPTSVMWFMIVISAELLTIGLSLLWYGVCRLLKQYFTQLIREVHKAGSASARQTKSATGDDRLNSVIAEFREFQKKSDARDAHLEVLVKQSNSAMEHIREGIIQGIIPSERTRAYQKPIPHPASRPRD